MSAPDRKKWQNYINGAFCDGTEPPIIVDNPATGQPLAEQACGNADDIDRAVAAAKACHDSRALSALRPVERSRKVQQMGRYLAENVKEIAPLLTLESGKPLWEAEMEVLGAARYFEYYGNQGETVEGRSIPLGDGYYDFTVYEPYGVSGQIIPWNYPLEMTARSLSAALVTGNACVIKSPELDPLTHFYIAKAAESADMPAGAVNIVCGHGKTAGAALAAHPDVRQIVFTGSVETGIAVGTAIHDLAVQDRATTVAEDIGLVESVQRGLGSRGYRPGPLVVDPDCGVNSEHSVKALHEWMRAVSD